MTELSDQLLLRAYCQGDRDAFDALYRRYAARLYATAYRLTGSGEDAEDALQEVFLQLARKPGSIRHAPALSSWLYRSTVNRAIDSRRRSARLFPLDVDSPRAARIMAVESLRREAEQREDKRRAAMLQWVGEHLLALPERPAAVFVLHGFQGLSYAEIAQVLESTEASCRTAYSMACTALRRIARREESATGEHAVEAGKMP